MIKRHYGYVHSEGNCVAVYTGDNSKELAEALGRDRDLDGRHGDIVLVNLEVLTEPDEKERCPYYWGDHAKRCLLTAGHDGLCTYPLTEKDVQYFTDGDTSKISQLRDENERLQKGYEEQRQLRLAERDERDSLNAELATLRDEVIGIAGGDHIDPRDGETMLDAAIRVLKTQKSELAAVKAVPAATQFQLDLLDQERARHRRLENQWAGEKVWLEAERDHDRAEKVAAMKMVAEAERKNRSDHATHLIELDDAARAAGIEIARRDANAQAARELAELRVLARDPATGLMLGKGETVERFGHLLGLG